MHQIRFGSEINLLFVIQTVNNAGFSASLPFIAIYLLKVRQVAVSEVGIIYLLSGILVVGQILSGRLTDSFGARKLILAELAASVLASAALIVLVLSRASVILFFVLYPVLSFVNSASQLTMSTIVANHKRSDRPREFALLYTGSNIGFTIGPAMGGLIVTYYGYAALFLSQLSCSLLAFVICLSRLYVSTGIEQEQKEVEKDSIKQKLPSSVILFFLLVFASWFLIGYAIIPLSIYASNFLGMSNLLLGYLVATNGLLIVILQLPFSRMMNTHNRIILSLALAGALQACGYFLMSSLRTFAGLEAVMVVLTLGELLIAVPSQFVTTLYSGGGKSGTFQGYFSAISRAGIYLADFVGPFLLGFFFSSPQVSWYIVSGISILTGVGFVLLSTKWRTFWRE